MQHLEVTMTDKVVQVGRKETQQQDNSPKEQSTNKPDQQQIPIYEPRDGQKGL
jgi:hypothetical protein